MNYLNRIIAVNSFLYSKGGIDVYDIHGGAVVLGSNTMGKSSLLRTQLLFYGAKPEYIAKLSGNKNLTQFYFKTHSSYLVFEYIKDNNPYLVVTCSKDQQTVLYYFVTGSFDENLFLKKDDGATPTFISNRDIKRHMQSMERHVSAEQGYKDYSEIIQDGRLERGNGEKGRKRNELRQRFSICPRNTSIKGVDRIALSIIDSTPSFETIKRLIAHDVSETGEEVKKILSDNVNNIHQLNWDMKILTQSKKFLEQKNRLSNLKNLKQTIFANNSKLRAYKHEAEVRIKSHSSEVIELNIDHSSIKKLLDDLGDKHKSFISEIDSKIGQNKAAFSTLKVEIKSIKDAFKSYQENDIEQHRVKANEIPLIEAEETQLQERLRVLTERYDSIISQYDKEFNSYKEQKNRLLDEERERVGIAVDSINLQVGEINSSTPSRINNIHSEYEAKLESNNDLIRELSNKITLNRQQLKFPDSEELDRISTEIKSIEQEISRISLKQTELAQEESGLLTKVSELSNQRRDKLTLLSTEKLHKSETENAIKDLQGELEVVESMLYFRVLELDPAKAGLMARTLKESVLKSKAPDELNISEQNDILGLDIDFSAFESEKPDAKDAIEANLRRLTSNENRHKEVIKELSSELSVLNIQIDQIDVQKGENKVQQGINRNKLLSEKDKLNAYVTKQELEVEKIKLETQSVIDKLENRLEDLKTRKSEILSQKQSEIERFQESTQNQIKELHEKIQSEKSKLKLIEDDTRKGIALKEDEIEQAKSRDLTKEGAQTSVIQETQDALANLSVRLNNAKESSRLFSVYENWLQNTYALLPGKKSKRDDFDATVTESEKRKQNAVDSYNQDKEVLVDKKKVAWSKIEKIENEINILESLLINGVSEFAQLESRAQANPIELPAGEIKSEVLRISKENSRYNTEGKEGFSFLMKSLRSYPELMELCSELLASEGLSDMGAVHEWKESIGSADSLLNGLLQQEVSARVDKIQALADQLLSLNGYLDEIDSGISRIGRKISKHMNESAHQFDAISGLMAKITSSIRTMKYKKELEKATAIINRRKGLEPDDEYLSTIQNAVKAIEAEGKRLDLTSMINISISLIDKHGVKKQPATSDKELLKISSEGMSFLILVMVFIAIKNSINNNDGVEILWSLDEVGRIHPDNVKIISEILRAEKISFICAGPNIDARVASLFSHIYKIVNNKELGRDIVVKTEAQPTVAQIAKQFLPSNHSEVSE